MSRNSGNSVRAVTRVLNCAGLDAVKPCVLKLRVAGISALAKPSTAGSATTDFAGFGESTALVAYASGERSGCGGWASPHTRNTTH